MLDLQPLAALAALNLAAAASPGPGFVLVSRTAAGSGRRSAMLAAAGTVCASVIWAAAAVLGLQVVLAKAATVYRVLQFAGGLYLALAGLAIWRGARAPLEVSSGSGEVPHAFRRGLLLGLSNPKVIIFFGTIFAAVFSPSRGASFKWAALVVVLIVETSWYGGVAALFGIRPVQSAYRRVKTVVERVFGGFLVLFGGRISYNSLAPAEIHP
jgi:threonine/homoserine/homoserine lactone efflux protein